MIQKPFYLVLAILCISLKSIGQVLINHSIVEQPPYLVGDTVTVVYSLKNISSNQEVRSVWLRTQYSNKHLELIPNSTVFLGNQWQTYNYQWVGYRFVPNASIPTLSLDGQYYSGGWQYVLDPAWNVNQLNFQSPASLTNTGWATQKFFIKDQVDHLNIHDLHMADIRDSVGEAVRPVSTETSPLSLNQVLGISSSTVIKVEAPSGYDLSDHKILIYNLDQKNNPDYTSVVASLTVDSSGEVFTTALQTGNSYYVEIQPPLSKAFIDDIITVTDAYKGFLQVSDRGLNSDQDYFKLPIEFKTGDVDGDGLFTKTDAYILFAYVSGLEIPSNFSITSSTSNNIKFISGKKATFHQGVFENKIDILDQNHTFQFAYIWGGDLDFSHSTQPPSQNNTSNRITTESSRTVSIVSKLEGNKVVVEFKLPGENLAGTQFKIKFDKSVLELEDIAFDTGNGVTNFKALNSNILKFGTIETQGIEKLKSNLTYRITFNSNRQLTSTTGLVFIDFSEAVTVNGVKIKLNVD
jgi:hypothetical protein